MRLLIAFFTIGQTIAGIVCLATLLVTNPAQAEGGCPPGMIPYSGTNLGSCGPMPGSGGAGPASPPPARWVDHWGAIATYEPNGSLGTATDMPTQESAEMAAMVACQSKHGSKCRIQLSYRNQCAAMVVSGKGYNVTPGTSINEAARKGMKICVASGDPNCHVYYTGCSLPVRIQ